MPAMNRVQKVGAQAVIGAFPTVATSIAEAEVNIRTVRERHIEKATKFLGQYSHATRVKPTLTVNTTMFHRFSSSLQKIVDIHRQMLTDRMKIIDLFAISPWDERIPVIIEVENQVTTEIANVTQVIRIATSSSDRNEIVDMRIAVHDTLDIVTRREPITQSSTIAVRAEQNPYIAGLTAIATALKTLPLHLISRQITILSSNQGAIRAIAQPKHQSGQTSIRDIYEAVRTLREEGNSISIV